VVFRVAGTKVIDLVLVQWHTGNVVDNTIDQVPVVVEALGKLEDAHEVALDRLLAVGIVPQMVAVILVEPHRYITHRIIHQRRHLAQRRFAARIDDLAEVGIIVLRKCQALFRLRPIPGGSVRVGLCQLQRFPQIR
jgi:hypothetical protein